MRYLWIMLTLLPHFGFAEPQSKRFDAAFTSLRSIFESSNAETVVDELAKRGRSPLFAVEGLARLYRTEHPDTMDALRTESKALEDRVGKLVDHGEHIEYAKAIGASPKVLSYLVTEQTNYRQGLAAYLREQGWVGTNQSVVDRWETLTTQTKWDKRKYDRQFVLESLIELTQELRKEDWQIRDLQNGLHDFRRRVRWLLIYLQSLGGIIEFDGRPLKRLGDILKDPVASGPYGKLPPGERDKFPILIPREVYLELTKAVDELGRAKDTGEALYEWLPEALLKSGEAATEAEAQKMAAEMVKKHPRYVPVFETGESIMAHLRGNDHRFEPKEDRGILIALKERLKEQVDWSKADCRQALKGI